MSQPGVRAHNEVYIASVVARPVVSFRQIGQTGDCFILPPRLLLPSGSGVRKGSHPVTKGCLKMRERATNPSRTGEPQSLNLCVSPAAIHPHQTVIANERPTEAGSRSIERRTFRIRLDIRFRSIGQCQAIVGVCRWDKWPLAFGSPIGFDAARGKGVSEKRKKCVRSSGQRHRKERNGANQTIKAARR